MHQLLRLKLLGRADFDPFMDVSHTQPDGDRLRNKQTDELSVLSLTVIGE